MQGVTSVQFLAAFHRFLGGDVELSRNAMNEFFHNLSWHALTNDNDSVKIKFEAITEFVKGINSLLQKKIYESKKRTQEINARIQNELLEKEIAQIRTKNEQVEREIVKDILNNNTTDYTPKFTLATIKTDAEAELDKTRENENYITTELVKKQRDIQIIDDITKKDQKDLIRSVTDPADGILTNENITPSDWTRSDNNEPVQPQLDPGVINVMQEMVRIMSEQTAVIDSIKNPPQPLVNPSNNPIQIATQPDLQDILTKETPDFTDIIKIKDEITDVISDTNNVVPPNNIVPQIRLDFPSPTGNPEIDQKNLDDYYDTLQQIRPDAFISEDEEDGDDNTPIDGQNTPAINDGIKKETDDVPIFPPDNIVPIKKETDDLPIFPPDNTQIRLDFPLPTGNPEIDQKNLDDYYDTLQQIRPDAFTSEDEEDDDVIGDNKPIDGQNDEETKYTPYVDSDGNILLKSKNKNKKYIPKINKRNKIYRDKAKKKAILAQIKATRLKNNKSRYKTNVLVPTDTTNDEIGNPEIATIIPPLPKVEDDIALTEDDDVDFKVDKADSDDDVTYVKYISPPPEIPVPPPIHPRDRLKQQLTAPKSPEIETFSDDETIDYVPTKEEIDELSDADLSDTEIISDLPNYNRRNQIYREKAKKRALKILSRTREKRKNRYKKNTIESKVHVLGPTEVEIKTDNPIDILANPNVTTILPGQLETEDDIIDYKPPVDIPSSDSNVTNHVPLQLDTDKIIMKDDGDIVLTEPDNMQVSEGALVPISNNTLQLENNTDMSEIATRNIVLKRKLPDVSVANIKKTKGDTEISIQHPIFRKMQKQSNLDKKIAKILSQGKPIDIEVANDNLLAIEDKPTLPMLLPSSSSSENIPTVDSETMRMMPWIDFDVILQNIDKNERERVILDLLQANMPNMGEDLYYIDHDPVTNVFSIKKDILADEITDFVESIRVIDAKLRLQTLTRQERNNLLRTRRLKISELRKTYKAHTLADVLDNRLSETEKQILEDEAVELLKELNKEEDLYYYRFNNDTQEIEIMLEEEPNLRINAIVFAALQLKKVIKDPATSNSRKKFLKNELKNLLDYLDSKGARLLAETLR